MNNREKFKKAVVMLNHPECETYEDALAEEIFIDTGNEHWWEAYPITLERVKQALISKDKNNVYSRWYHYKIDQIILDKIILDLLVQDWELNKLDDEQTEETINKLLELLT